MSSSSQETEPAVAEPSVAQLIVAQGSNAGSVAPVHPGYYLVGRAPECQIRPKSRSVSRRHCLLLHNEDGLGALDLKSTSGTYLNGSRIEPHAWRVLRDGDELRFGKVAFKVSLPQQKTTEPPNGKQAVSKQAPENQGPAPQANSRNGKASHPIAHRRDAQPSQKRSDVAPPDSWQNVDVAEFLEIENLFEEDDSSPDLSSRMDVDSTPPKDPGKASVAENSKSPESSPTSSPELRDEKISDSDLFDSLIDDPEDPEDAHDEDAHDSDVELEVDAAPKARPPRKKLDHNQYKKKQRKSISLPSFSGEMNWKMIGAILAVVTTLGLLSYQLYGFVGGPDVQVRRNLD